MDRIAPYALRVRNHGKIPVTLFANENVNIERKAVDELQSFLELQQTVESIRDADPDFFSDSEAGVKQVAVTPDFHKGAGIPIGTVSLMRGFIAPQAIGKDVNCGMRLLITDWSEEEVRSRMPELTKRIRHSYFQGGRDIPMDRSQKVALLREGLHGLIESSGRRGDQGIWKYFRKEDQLADLHRVIDQGSLPADGVIRSLENYLGDNENLSWDSQIGSIGGGNHFVEVQKIKRIHDSSTAYAWGLKKDAVVIMVHTGSVSVGYPASQYMREILREIYPAGLPHPKNGIYPLPVSEKYASQWRQFRIALHNAANFAFANRLFLGLMMQRIFQETLGDRGVNLLYDSGHNLVWPHEVDGINHFLHRKGACPARGPESMAATPFNWTGEPALIPGSMGSNSFIMAGTGKADSLFSASHGAGRAMSRGKSMRASDDEFRKFIQDFHIITPIDPESPQIRNRRDIMAKWEAEVKQEAPWAFKDIGPVIDTQVEAGMVRAIAETEPIFTVKG
jgi:tRNA-splicing ligase RtcB